MRNAEQERIVVFMPFSIDNLTERNQRKYLKQKHIKFSEFVRISGEDTKTEREEREVKENTGL